MSEVTPEHGKVTNIELHSDGTAVIDTETFYNGELTTFKKEIEQSVLVSRKDILSEIMEALKIDSPVITLTIRKSKTLEPERLIKKWIVIDDRVRKTSH